MGGLLGSRGRCLIAASVNASPRPLRGSLALPFAAQTSCAGGAGTAAVNLTFAPVAASIDFVAASITSHHLYSLLPTSIDDFRGHLVSFSNENKMLFIGLGHI